MHGCLVASGLLLLAAASFTLAMPILDITGLMGRLYPTYLATPGTAMRLALAGVVCLAVGWLIYRRRGGV